MNQIRMTLIRGAMGLAALATAGAAQAQGYTFSGSITGLGLAGPDASCAPAPARGVLDPSTSTGTSTLGAFTYGHNWCFYGPSGPIEGTFGLDFGVSTLFGTVTGMATPTATMGVADLDLTYTILGGTGTFADATGSFGGTAISDVRAGDGSHFSLNFLGSIDAPALPEPGSWALLLLGFGTLGFVIRRERSKATNLAIPIG